MTLELSSQIDDRQAQTRLQALRRVFGDVTPLLRRVENTLQQRRQQRVAALGFASSQSRDQAGSQGRSLSAAISRRVGRSSEFTLDGSQRAELLGLLRRHFKTV
ncbi:MAG: hypothetical protein OET90_05305 [Desulfuromonadales bacterium]|nr:hypothetical protein [Desulfuromonadales bacterium]